MKLLVFFLMMATTNVQDGTTMLIKDVVVSEQDNKREISAQELPEAVVTAFQESEYSEWTVGKVYQLDGSAETTYELHLVSGDETMVLVADAQGNLQPKTEG